MKTLCVFIHYDKSKISFYVRYYIQNLLKHCDDLIFVTNLININDDFIKNSNKIKILSFKNEVYDFGYLYKALNSTDISKYDRLIFANDSNIMFSTLDNIMNWGNNNNLDFWGVTDSFEKIPGYKIINTYHIQSPFLVFEKRAMYLLFDFFDEIQFIDLFNETLVERDLRLTVISKCEMGLTEYFIKKGLRVKSYFSVKEFSPKYLNRPYENVNLHIWLWKELIENGYPFIKKKIVTNGWDPINEPKKSLPDFSNWKTVIKNKIKNEPLLEKILVL